MRKLIAKFLADQSGATAIEYSIIAIGVSIVIVASVNSMGTALSERIAQDADVFAFLFGQLGVKADAGK